MTKDTRGAITQAIEALDPDNWEWNWLDDDADSLSEQRQILEQALEALKAFRDGVPEELEETMNSLNILQPFPENNSISTALKAAKHLQGGIE